MAGRSVAGELLARVQLQLELLGALADELAELQVLLANAGNALPWMQRCEAAAASMVVAAPSVAGFVVTGPPARRVAMLYLAAASQALAGRPRAAALLDGQALLAEALFILGREAMKEATQEGEAARRSANAKRGAPEKRFADDALVQIRGAWLHEHGHERGWMKEAARQLDVTERTISARWKEITGTS